MTLGTWTWAESVATALEWQTPQVFVGGPVLYALGWGVNLLWRILLADRGSWFERLGSVTKGL